MRLRLKLKKRSETLGQGELEAAIGIEPMK